MQNIDKSNNKIKYNDAFSKTNEPLDEIKEQKLLETKQMLINSSIT